MTFDENLRDGKIFYIIILFFLLFTTINVEAWNPEDCPTFCECYSHWGLRWAECVGRHLFSIHTGVNQAVQGLDLSNNTIASLADYELKEASLTNLKLLNLSTNAISEIGLKAFDGLSDLRVLDLSKNHLYYLLPNTFIDNKKLEVLELAGNNLNELPKLRSSSLASLGLEGCRISYLPPDTFDDLPRLRVLDLTENMMIQLEFDILKSIPNLGVLMLDRNPWSCNSQMYELQERLKERDVIFRKICDYNKTSKKVKSSKKFEKMIALEEDTTTTSNEVGGSGRLLAKIKNLKNSWKNETTSKRLPTNVITTKNNENPFDRNLSTISPYWIFVIGLILGSTVGTVATYLWLTNTITCTLENSRRRNIRPESLEIADQRANLLEHLWRNNMDTNRPITECPGTPPPPYRDVIQHATRYPRPHIQAIVFTNESVTHDERQNHS